jgi:hypothetical protein
MNNYSSSETSVGMYKLKEAMEEFCSDLLAAHQRKYACDLAGFSSHRKVMKSPLMGTGNKTL